MSFYIEILERSKQNKEIIGIWKYNNEDSFLCGYVLHHDENIVVFKQYTKFGKDDGIAIIAMDDIENIDFNDDYSMAMQHVIVNEAQLDIEEPINLNLSGENWQEDILKQFEGSDKVISIEKNGSYYSGFVLKVSEVDFIFQCLGKMGEDEGTTIYRIEDITGFDLNDIQNRKQALLYKFRKNNAQNR